MIVKKLFIVALTSSVSDDAAMIQGTTRGLLERYGRKLGEGNVMLIPLHVDQQPESSNWIESIKLDRETHVAAVKDACANFDDIGLYISTQGRGPREEDDRLAKCLEPGDLVKLIQTLGFTKLRKLCLITCHCQQNWGGRLARSLQAAGMRPMIAGWNTFVTAYHSSKDDNKDKIYAGAAKDKQTHTKDLPAEAKQDLVGRKVTKGEASHWSQRHLIPVSYDEDGGVAIRNKYKWIVQHDGSQVKTLTLEQWTDKK